MGTILSNKQKIKKQLLNHKYNLCHYSLLGFKMYLLLKTEKTKKRDIAHKYYRKKKLKDVFTQMHNYIKLIHLKEQKETISLTQSENSYVFALLKKSLFSWKYYTSRKLITKARYHKATVNWIKSIYKKGMKGLKAHLMQKIVKKQENDHYKMMKNKKTLYYCMKKLKAFVLHVRKKKLLSGISKKFKQKSIFRLWEKMYEKRLNSKKRTNAINNFSSIQLLKKCWKKFALLLKQKKKKEIMVAKIHEKHLKNIAQSFLNNWKYKSHLSATQKKCKRKTQSKILNFSLKKWKNRFFGKNRLKVIEKSVKHLRILSYKSFISVLLKKWNTIIKKKQKAKISKIKLQAKRKTNEIVLFFSKWILAAANSLKQKQITEAQNNKILTEKADASLKLLTKLDEESQIRKLAIENEKQKESTILTSLQAKNDIIKKQEEQLAILNTECEEYEKKIYYFVQDSSNVEQELAATEINVKNQKEKHSEKFEALKKENASLQLNVDDLEKKTKERQEELMITEKELLKINNKDQKSSKEFFQGLEETMETNRNLITELDNKKKELQTLNQKYDKLCEERQELSKKLQGIPEIPKSAAKVKNEEKIYVTNTTKHNIIEIKFSDFTKRNGSY